MRIENRRETPQPIESSNKILEASQKSFRSFQDYVEFRDDDPLWMLGYKLFLRFVGIGVMILLSPFLVIGLLIAIAAVL